MVPRCRRDIEGDGGCRGMKALAGGLDNDYTIKESGELGIGVLWIEDLLYIWKPVMAQT